MVFKPTLDHRIRIYLQESTEVFCAFKWMLGKSCSMADLQQFFTGKLYVLMYQLKLPAEELLWSALNCIEDPSIPMSDMRTMTQSYPVSYIPFCPCAWQTFSSTHPPPPQSSVTPWTHTHRCAKPVPLNLGGLYLYHLLCQLCRESKQNNIRERDKQTAAENREMEERHQRSA
ncbi:hypothetical protein F7725_020821, partial [Dissostichus mawsoni]